MQQQGDFPRPLPTVSWRTRRRLPPSQTELPTLPGSTRPQGPLAQAGWPRHESMRTMTAWAIRGPDGTAYGVLLSPINDRAKKEKSQQPEIMITLNSELTVTVT